LVAGHCRQQRRANYYAELQQSSKSDARQHGQSPANDAVIAIDARDHIQPGRSTTWNANTPRHGVSTSHNYAAYNHDRCYHPRHDARHDYARHDCARNEHTRNDYARDKLAWRPAAMSLLQITDLARSQG
jgi:hypothetical protein